VQTTRDKNGIKLQAKQYDLEDRTRVFAENVRAFAKKIPKTLANVEDAKQVVRLQVLLGRTILKRMNP
jgi:hypothetical protein